MRICSIFKPKNIARRDKMPKRKKSKIPLILFIILIVIIAGVAAMYFYTQIKINRTIPTLL